MTLRHVAVAAGFALGLMSSGAKAELLHFDYQDPYEPLSFNLNSRPTPLHDGLGDTFIRASNNAIYYGKSVPYFDLQFNTVDNGGGFGNFYFPGGPLPEGVFGDQLFTGDLLHPLFSPGSYNLLAPSGAPVTLVISIVPLPATAPMFGVAVLALGAAGYGLKRKRAAAA